MIDIASRRTPDIAPTAVADRAPAPALRSRSASAGLLTLVALALAAGCRPDGSTAPEGAPGTATEAALDMAADEATGEAEGAAEGELPAPAREIPAALREAPEVIAAIEAAAQAEGVQTDEVSLLDVNEVTWPDSGLGCGEPGVSYLQVLTPGYRVVVWAGGRRVIYHTTRGAEAVSVVPCSSARSKEYSVETLAGGMLGRIIEDLRERVGEEVAITPLGLNLVPLRTLTCDDLQVGLPTADPASAGSVSAMRLAVTEFRLQAGSAIHRYRSYEDEFLYCGQQGVDAEGNPTD